MANTVHVITKGATSGVGSGVSSIVSGLFVLIRKNLFWVITILSLLTISGVAISESVREQSILPAVIKIGGALLSSDTVVFENALTFEKNNYQFIIKTEKEGNVLYRFYHTTKGTIMLYSEILSALWLLVAFWIILYKLMRTHNDSERSFNALAATFIFVVLMVLATLTLHDIRFKDAVYNDDIPLPDYETATKEHTDCYYPLRGVRRLIKGLYLRFADKIPIPVTPFDNFPKLNNTINQSVNVTL